MHRDVIFGVKYQMIQQLGSLERNNNSIMTAEKLNSFYSSILVTHKKDTEQFEHGTNSILLSLYAEPNLLDHQAMQAVF